MINWYSIFYWLSVADGVKDFFDAFSNIFTFLAILSTILLIIMLAVRGDKSLARNEEEKNSMRYWLTFSRRSFFWSVFLSMITWCGYMMVPSKKDCYIIVAGGAVGNFIQSDSAAKNIPSEALQLLRDKIRQESQELSIKKITEAVSDTLKDKSKEELIEMLKHNNK
jgi:hypothetical protein